MFITHRPTLTLQRHNFDLFRTCGTSSFCTAAWQLARFQLTQRITRSLGDSGASCHISLQMAMDKLKKLKMNKAPGIDLIGTRMLIELSENSEVLCDTG